MSKSFLHAKFDQVLQKNTGIFLFVSLPLTHLCSWWPNLCSNPSFLSSLVEPYFFVETLICVVLHHFVDWAQTPNFKRKSYFVIMTTFATLKDKVTVTVTANSFLELFYDNFKGLCNKFSLLLILCPIFEIILILYSHCYVLMYFLCLE